MSRSYSLLNAAGENLYRVAVQREEGGGGGSKYLHDQVRVGDILRVSAPVNHFALDETAERSVLIGGGIGITPLIAMARRLNEIDADFSLHYCVRSRAALAFEAEARDVCGPDRLVVHIDDADSAVGLDVAYLLAAPRRGTHVYCCGPAGLLRAVQAATIGWPAGAVHFESFSPARSEEFSPTPAVLRDVAACFEIVVASTGEVIGVMPGQSVLDALRGRGVEIDSSCESGTCGACRTRVLEGEVEHRDFVLSDEEQADWMMVCVSGARSKRLRLQL
jgi:ferredoxin-NADP reductase